MQDIGRVRIAKSRECGWQASPSDEGIKPAAQSVQLRGYGVPLHRVPQEALSSIAVAATQHRLRPILVTAAAAILGMIPIAPTVVWGPMAYAVMGGLVVATLTGTPAGCVR